MVDHSILLHKLYHHGVRGCASHWFQIYLSNKSQSVTYDGVKSSLGFLKCGVPQGSILGPLLFLLYINDLFKSVNIPFQYSLQMILIYFSVVRMVHLCRKR